MMRSLFLSLLVLLSACAPKEQPYHPAATGEAKLEKNIFYAPDMAMLPYRAWLPKQKPKAVVVALHGFNDYSNAFSDVGPYFAARRIAFYAYDQRGFGATRDAGIWGHQQNLINDLRQFVKSASARHKGAPIYILGESMGGAVAINALAQGDVAVNGLILSAPAIWGGDTLPLIYRGTLWTSAHLAPYWQLTGSDLKIQASNNIPMLRKLSMDPLVIKATRVDAVYGLVSLMDGAYDNIPNVKVPVLLLYGGQDQVILKDPMEVALARFSQPITFVFYPDGYHMLLRDLQAEDVMADAASWILYPKRPIPSGFAREIAPSKK